MPQRDDEDTLTRVFRRMGEPSWWILRVLSATEPIPGIEIIQRVHRLLATADYPMKRLDPATLHYALKRMDDDGLIRGEGDREVEVPGPRRTIRLAMRPVYVITGLGEVALARRRRLETLPTSAALGPGWEQLAAERVR